MLPDGRIRKMTQPLSSRKPTDTGHALEEEEEDPGLSLLLSLLAIGLAAEVSTKTPNIATIEQHKSALPVLPLLVSFNIDEANLENVRASDRQAESERVCQLLLLGSLAQPLQDCMRNTRLRRNVGQHRGRSQGRGQDQGQCSPALLGAAVVGVEAK